MTYQLCSVDPRFYERPVVLHGRDCAEQFLDHILEDAQRVRAWLAAPEPQPILKAIEKRQFDDAASCHICVKPLYLFDFQIGMPDAELIDGKVADHDHITGKFRGAAHNRCNLNYRIKAKTI